MKIALLPGGFKPPHLGHYNMAKYLAGFADKVIVRIGQKEREGIGKELALEIWNFYKEFDPDSRSKKLVISVAQSPSPVKDVYDFVEKIAPEGSTVILGLGEKDASDGRYNSIPKFAEPRNIKADIELVPPQAGGISGTRMREIIKSNNKEEFFKFIPEYLPEEIKEEIWTKLLDTTMPAEVEEMMAGTMNAEEMAKHNANMKKLRKFFSKQDDQMIQVPTKLTKGLRRKLYEGRYDQETLLQGRFLLDKFKANFGKYHEEDTGGVIGFDKEAQEPIEYSLEFKFIPKKDIPLLSFIMDGEADGDIMKIKIKYNPNRFPEAYNDLNAEIRDTVRHELEHVAQHHFSKEVNPQGNKKKPTQTWYEYFTSAVEIPAFTQGLYKNSKFKKISFSKAVKNFLLNYLDVLTDKEEISVINTWTDYARKNLPAAQIDEGDTYEPVGENFPPYKANQVQQTRYRSSDTFTNDPKKAKKLGYLQEKDPKVGTGKKPKGSGRRLYTDENPKDTVSIKFSTRQDIVDTLSKKSFKSKSHARQSQIINLIHQRVRAAYGRAKDPAVKKRLKTGLDYITKRKEASKRKTQRMKKENINEGLFKSLFRATVGPIILRPIVTALFKSLSEKFPNKKKLILEMQPIVMGAIAAGKIGSVFELTLFIKNNNEELADMIREASSELVKIVKQYIKPKLRESSTFSKEWWLDVITEDILDKDINEVEFKHISPKESKIKDAIKDVEKKARLKANRDKPVEYKQLSLNKIMLSKVLGREKLGKEHQGAWEKLKKEYNLKESFNLNEGGAAGHMAHPFDLPSVNNGKDLIKAFEQAADSLKKSPGSVKIDGVNASIRLINLDGKRIFAMDRGSKKALDLRGVTKADLEDRFGAGHGMIKSGGDVLDIFNDALPSIQGELKALGLYDDPNIMFNMEYVSGKSNVQDYGKNFLAIHGLLSVETKEVQGARKMLTKRITSEKQFAQSDMDELLKKLEPFAKKKGFEIYGSVPTTFKKDPDFKAALNTRYTIDFAEGDKTKTLGQWLNDVNSIPKTDRLKMNIDKGTKDIGVTKDVGALSKQVYFAVFGEKNIDDLFDNEQEINKAIQGATTYLATEKLGDAILDVLDSPMGSVNDHEGVVIRDTDISPKPFKVTGKFITGGVSSDFQKK